VKRVGNCFEKIDEEDEKVVAAQNTFRILIDIIITGYLGEKMKGRQGT